MLILHGDNLVASRKELEKIKEKNKEKEIVIFDGKSLSLTDLIEALEAKSLLGNEKLTIIENLLSQQKGRVGKNVKKSGFFPPIVEYINRCPEESQLLFWENKEIGKSLLALFKKAEVKLFKVEKQIFALIESLKPNHNQRLIILFRQCLLNNPVEIIFSMIIRQFRFLLLTKSAAKIGPFDFQKLAPWQKQRLTNQAKLFTMERLLEIYQKLLLIDYHNKTGRAVFDLTKTIELFLIEI